MIVVSDFGAEKYDHCNRVLVPTELVKRDQVYSRKQNYNRALVNFKNAKCSIH